jgi:hypothetical protein
MVHTMRAIWRPRHLLREQGPNGTPAAQVALTELMKKTQKRFSLNRDVVKKLETELPRDNLRRVQGGDDDYQSCSCCAVCGSGLGSCP